MTTNATPWPDQPTLLDHLRRAGYHTCGIGKFHQGGAVLPGKFDLWLGFTNQGQYRNPRLLDFDGKMVQQTGHVTDLLGDRAVAYLRRHRRDPFCLLLWFKSPHRDWQPADRFKDLLADRAMPRPRSFNDDLSGRPTALRHTRMQVETAKGSASFDSWVRDYYRTVAGVDENVGRVLAAVDELGLAERTIVVFTSDNGFFLGEHHFFDKRIMYEPSIRIPMVVRYPRRIEAGLRRRQMVLNVDLAPTLLGLAGLDAPARMQGRSWLPILDDPKAEWRKSWYYRYYEYPASHSVRPHRGVRTERFKYIEWPAMKRGSDEFPAEHELYDLETDPDEVHNLVADPKQADTLKDLRAELARLAKELDDQS